MVIICRSLRPGRRIPPALRSLSRQRAEVCGEDHSPNPGNTRTASHRIAAPPKKEGKAHPDHILICESAKRISKLIFDSACQRAIVRESSRRYRTTKKKAPTAHAAALTRRRRPAARKGRSGKNLSIDVDGSRRGACGSIPIPTVRVEQTPLRSSLRSQLYIASNIQRRHLSPCACAVCASVPEMQLMADPLLVKEAAEAAVAVEERVGLADGQDDVELAQLFQPPWAG